MKKFVLSCCLAVFCLAEIYSETISEAQKKAKEHWDSFALVKHYYHNSELQRQWSWALLGKYHFKGNEKVLDFGSGDGKISAEISRLVQDGSVLGVDISTDMIQFSNSKFPKNVYPNLSFFKSNTVHFSDLVGQHDYDLVTSFCTFQIIQEPEIALRNLHQHLKPTGKLLLVIPARGNPTLFQSIHETFVKLNLKPSIVNITNMATVEGCKATLERADFSIDYINLVNVETPFYDKKELSNWLISALAGLLGLSAEKGELFFTQVVDRMIEIDPSIIDKDGWLHFKFSRIQAIASPNQLSVE